MDPLEKTLIDSSPWHSKWHMDYTLNLTLISNANVSFWMSQTHFFVEKHRLPCRDVNYWAIRSTVLINPVRVLGRRLDASGLESHFFFREGYMIQLYRWSVEFSIHQSFYTFLNSRRALETCVIQAHFWLVITSARQLTAAWNYLMNWGWTWTNSVTWHTPALDALSRTSFELWSSIFRTFLFILLFSHRNC